MKLALTSKELEVRYRKSRNKIIVELSGELTVQARSAHIQEFVSGVKHCNGRKTIMLVAIES